MFTPQIGVAALLCSINHSQPKSFCLKRNDVNHWNILLRRGHEYTDAVTWLKLSKPPISWFVALFFNTPFFRFGAPTFRTILYTLYTWYLTVDAVHSSGLLFLFFSQNWSMCWWDFVFCFKILRDWCVLCWRQRLTDWLVALLLKWQQNVSFSERDRER